MVTKPELVVEVSQGESPKQTVRCMIPSGSLIQVVDEPPFKDRLLMLAEPIYFELVLSAFESIE